MLLPLLLLGCQAPPAAARPTPELPVDGVVVLDLTTRLGEGDPVWTATARMDDTPGEHPDSLLPGRCVSAAVETEPGAPGATSMSLSGIASGALTWDPERGVYRAAGPRQAGDPQWGVGDLSWEEPSGQKREAPGAVRFGTGPVIRRVERTNDGGVRVLWDPSTVESGEVTVSGPAGELRCGVMRDGVEVPWWAVPAKGGSLVVRSVHEHATLVGRILVNGRARIERLVPFDVPLPVVAPVKPLEKAPEVLRRPRGGVRKSVG